MYPSAQIARRNTMRLATFLSRINLDKSILKTELRRTLETALTALAAIRGIGESKLARFGEGILGIVAAELGGFAGTRGFSEIG